MNNFPLNNNKIVLTGDLAPFEFEDTKWSLIEKGAYIMDRVTKTTALVIAGPNAKKSILNAAKKHGIKIADPAILNALLKGPTINDAINGEVSDNSLGKAFEGLKIAINGSFSGISQKGFKDELERQGIGVSNKPSSKTDILIIGKNPSFQFIEIMDKGVPFLTYEDVLSIQKNNALTDFIGKRNVNIQVDIPKKIESLREAFISLDAGDEVWNDELEICIHTNGNVSTKLKELAGTPTENHVRSVIQRQDWPKVSTKFEYQMPIKFTFKV